MKLFSKNIAVVFIDDATGEKIAASDMPLDLLPDTFALGMTLDLAGAPYVVVRADPLTKAEFSKTKRLSVGLRRLETLDPKNILFSLPTICGTALPEVSTAAAPDDAVILQEDDWRQCEFISISHAADISAELAEIQQVRAEHAEAAGWRNIHVRERITQPLPTGVAWSKVHELLGDVGPLRGIAFGRRENAVAGVVGARLPDRVVLWGVADHGLLSTLCIENPEGASAATIAALTRVADGLSCAVVHWCNCQVYCRDITIENATRLPWSTAR